MKTPTYEQLKPYIEKGLVSDQAHPDAPWLHIFNYTQKCQFAREWDDITVQCRGLIINVDTGEVIARPFPKFFNYQEHIDRGEMIPGEQAVITEKLDGSLGILYWLNGEPWIATRGSFQSEQAVWATEWFRSKVPQAVEDKGVTHLFEIIYPQNRIVVRYDYSGLVHLVSLDNETGRPVPAVWSNPVRQARIYEWMPTVKLLELNNENEEGFVLYYPDANMRVKIKFAEYVRLHKLVTGLSYIAIWEYLRDGRSLNELLEKVPDEFYKWVEQVEMSLRTRFAKIWGQAQFARMMVDGGRRTRKDQALWIMENAKDVSGVVFSLLDGEDRKAVQQVWKMVRPHGNQSFKVDIDS